MIKIDTFEKYIKYIEASPESKKPTLLLHACCGPCYSAVFEALCRHFDITILFFNPSIYPEEEYDKRFDQFEKLGIEKIIKYPYDHESYLSYIKGTENEKEGGKRCFLCYEQRIKKTCEIAKEKGFNYFSTTLSISPHKNASWINEIGLSLSTDDCLFLYSDFKKRDGYLNSIRLSKEMGLYRQNYCGCEFSMRKDE